MIEFRGVTYVPEKGAAPLFSDLSFTVSKGEFCLITGKTGTGKSTILKLLTRELLPFSGEITIGGYSLSSLSRRKTAELRRSIGCVFQDIALLADKTASENVAFALEVQRKYSREKIAELVEKKLKEVGLLQKATAFPRELSLGERQRVSIARALITEPLVLLTDSATSQLDPESAKQIFAILKNENIRGMTILKMMNDTRFAGELPKNANWYELRGGTVAPFLPET
jgi:cell division transport system ATP-binding protein